jgi:hypothetical protein
MAIKKVHMDRSYIAVIEQRKRVEYSRSIRVLVPAGIDPYAILDSETASDAIHESGNAITDGWEYEDEEPYLPVIVDTLEMDGESCDITFEPPEVRKILEEIKENEEGEQ